jgi:predicted nucleic acid-binding protein
LKQLLDRDPEDAHALALAWALGLPLWSNDRDFEGQAVERYTTARLLHALEA